MENALLPTNTHESNKMVSSLSLGVNLKILLSDRKEDNKYIKKILSLIRQTEDNITPQIDHINLAIRILIKIYTLLVMTELR